MEKETGFVGVAGLAESYALDAALLTAAIESGDVRVITHKKGGNALSLKVTDADRGVKGAETPWNSLGANTSLGAQLIASGGEKDAAKNAQFALDAVTYAADLWARARARGVYLEKYGVRVVDEATAIAKLVKDLMALDPDLTLAEAQAEVVRMQKARAERAAARAAAEAQS